MPKKDFDLVVLGAGSGGIAMAIRAARHGARVAIIEQGFLGGTCVNVGCVPKKAMWLAAELAEAQELAQDVGFRLTPGALDWSAFIARRDAYIANIHATYRQRLSDLRITLFEERGRLLDAHRIAAGAHELHALHVLVATGACPERAEVPGAELGIDSDDFFALRERPRRVAIVGSGYIAVELAGVLRALGSEVTLFARGERVLRSFDHEIGDALVDAMDARGIECAFSHKTISAHHDADGYALRFASGESRGGFDELIWAVGRKPNTSGIGLEQAGVDLDKNGFIITDVWQSTSAPNIHAVGDVTGRIALTPVAIAASRCLADRLFGGVSDARLDYDNIATVVFSHPPLGVIGLSEAAARERHGDAVKVYRSRFRPMLGALAQREEKTLMKLVCVGPDERVVGIHIIGAAADEILQGFAIAMKMGARKADFDATVAIHPTSAEELVLM